MPLFFFWRDEISKYEIEFANKFGCKHGVMFSYGRSALFYLFKVWGIVNKEIITPAYTCVVVPHAVVLSGNIPRFVDCEKEGYNMDYHQLESSITKKTGAIIVTHLFGYAMDVKRIEKIVKKAEKKFNSKIFVIQDLAHSYGTSYNGEKVSKYGDASIFGCNISKIINSIFGGMVITNDSKTYSSLIEIQEKLIQPKFVKEIYRFMYLVTTIFAFNPKIYGLVNFLEKRGFLNRFTKYYDEDTIEFPDDWNEKPKKIEARVGRVQLSKYDSILDKRRQIAKKVIFSFKNRDDIKLMDFSNESTYSHIVALVEDRNRWIEDYYKKGKQLGKIIDYSIPEFNSYQKYNKNNDDYPHARNCSKKIINFPI